VKEIIMIEVVLATLPARPTRARTEMNATCVRTMPRVYATRFTTHPGRHWYHVRTQ